MLKLNHNMKSVISSAEGGAKVCARENFGNFIQPIY